MTDNFAKCKEIAIALSDALPESIVCYGIYSPITPKEVWDERWQINPIEQFVHYWVEYRERIIDAAKEQYGEPFLNIAPLEDIRYVKVGILKGDKTIPIVDDPQIDFSTYTGNPLKPISVLWREWDKYRAQLEEVKTQERQKNGSL